MLSVLVGCGTGSPPSTASPTGPSVVIPSEPPVISALTATPATIDDGDESVLSWEVSDPMATLKLAPGRQQVTGNSATVKPVVSTTYTLTATNAMGIDVESVTVIVNPISGIPTTAVADAAPTAQWVNATANLEGLPSECGNLSSVGSISDVVIAGVALRGLWALADSSDEWQPLGQQGGAEITNRMHVLVQDPDDPATFWESGSYSGGGVYRTTDGGASFQRLGDITFVDGLSIDFSDPARQTMVAGSHEQPTVYRSADGGGTWALISDGLPDDIGYASAPLVIDAATYLIGTNNGEESGIFRTTDSGLTWTRITTFGTVGQPVRDPSDGALYWLLEARGGIARSTDNGETWEVVSRSPSAAASASLALLPDGRLAAIGDGSVIVSSDRGETWERFGPSLPYEPNGFTFSPVRNSFYAWRFDCVFGTDNPVPPDAIVRLDLSHTAPPDVATTSEPAP